MAADYPTSVKSFATKVDNVDLVMAADINDIQTEVAAIETQLITSKLATLTSAPAASKVLTTDGSGVPTWAAKAPDSDLLDGINSSGFSPVMAWTEWDPTITSVTGTLTTFSAEHSSYYKSGVTVFIRFRMQITTNGTGATAIKISLPFLGSGEGYESFYGTVVNNASGAGLFTAMAVMNPDQDSILVYKYDGTYPGSDGYNVHVEGYYTAAS